MNYQLMPDPDDLRGGHIPNYVVPLWFENARMPLWKQVTLLQGGDAKFGIVRHASYDYRREIFGGAQVTIETWVKSIGTSSAVCHQQAWQSGQLAVVVTVTLVAVGEASNTNMALSPAARAYLQSQLKEPVH